MFGIEIAARGRPEQIEPPHVKAAAQRTQLLAMQFNFVNHVGVSAKSSLLQVFAQRSIDPRLPAGPGGAELLDDIRVEPERNELLHGFGLGAARPPSRADQLCAGPELLTV